MLGRILRRWMGGGESPQTVRVVGVLFRGEQDGVPERDLKRELTALFQSRSDVESAYLAVVSYQGGSGHGIALCITGVIEPAGRPEIAKVVSKIFAGMFGAHEHLEFCSRLMSRRVSSGRYASRSLFVASPNSCSKRAVTEIDFRLTPGPRFIARLSTTLHPGGTPGIAAALP
jgi:hypothetical protein